jgi:hypothetical protein
MKKLLPDYAYTINDNYTFVADVLVSTDAKNSPLTYYGHREIENENNLHMTLFNSFKDFDKNHDDLQIEAYIKETLKSWHRTGADLSEQDILDYTFGGSVTPEKFSEENPFILYFEGCDDGHFYLRFSTKEKRTEFVEKFKKLSFEEIEEIFYPTDALTDIMVFRDN